MSSAAAAETVLAVVTGTLKPGQQQTFPPINYGGSPLTITNTTNPAVPAVLQYVLS